MTGQSFDISWKKLPGKRGCSFRWYGTLAWSTLRGEIHIFVNSEMQPTRCIAVTFKGTGPRGSETRKRRATAAGPDDYAEMSSSLAEDLSALGATEEESRALVQAVARFLQTNRAALLEALAKAYPS